MSAITGIAYNANNKCFITFNGALPTVDLSNITLKYSYNNTFQTSSSPQSPVTVSTTSNINQAAWINSQLQIPINLNTIGGAAAKNMYYALYNTNTGSRITNTTTTSALSPTPKISKTWVNYAIAGASVTMTAPIVSGASYAWYNTNNNTTPISNTNVLTFNPVTTDKAGTYYVKVNDIQNTTADNITLTVYAKPTISATATTLFIGQSLSLTCNLPSGVTITSYQWKKNGANINGATSATYTKSGVQTEDAGLYTVLFTADTSSVTTDAKTINIYAIPTISANQSTLFTGQTLTLTGTPPVGVSGTYQWQKGGTDIVGATSAIYTKTAGTTDTGSYTVVFTSGDGYVTTAAASINVYAIPTLTATPATTLLVGQTLTLICNLPSGLSGGSYQWQRDGSTISGATSLTYSTTAGTEASGSYTVVYTNGSSSVTTGPVSVIVSQPTITATPNPAIVGTPVTLTCSATTSGTTTYQWYNDGSSITAATSSTYTFTPSDVGTPSYSVVVTDINGEASNVSILLTIQLPPPPIISAMSATYGSETSFTAEAHAGSVITLAASVSGATSYQWYYRKSLYLGDWAPITDATTDTYTISSAATSNTGHYIIKATNSGGTVDSDNLSVYVYTIPKLILSASIAEKGTNVTLSISNITFGYQYYLYNDNGLIGSDPDTWISFDNNNTSPITIDTSISGTFSYKVSIVSGTSNDTNDPNSGNIGFSDTVTLTVYPKPRISTSADTVTILESITLTFLDIDFTTYLYTLEESIDNGKTWDINNDSIMGDSINYQSIKQDGYDIRLSIALEDSILGYSDPVHITFTYAPAITGISAKSTYNSSTGESTTIFTFTEVPGAVSYKLIGASSDLPVLASNTTSPITYTTKVSLPSPLFYYIVAYNEEEYQLTKYQDSFLSTTISCLPRGTHVLTPAGYRLVEEIVSNDLVTTDDGRDVPVRVHRSATPCSDAKSAPVRIAARSFFSEYPVAPICVSPWHAFKVGPDNQWLIPKDVIGVDGVVQEPFGQAVEYYHFELPNFFTDNLVLEGGAVVESYGIPWIVKNNAWGKAIFKMDKAAGWARRRDPVEIIASVHK